MNTVDLYERAKRFATKLGYDVREENLCGAGGGACEVDGQKCLFVDLALTTPEQLEQILSALSDDPLAIARAIPSELQHAWPTRRAAA